MQHQRHIWYLVFATVCPLLPFLNFIHMCNLSFALPYILFFLLKTKTRKSELQISKNIYFFFFLVIFTFFQIIILSDALVV